MLETASEILTLRLTRILQVAPGVKSFTFEHPQGSDLPVSSPGSHVVLFVETDGHVRRNSYTLTGDPDDRKRFTVTVLHQPGGRGGSHYLHERARVGDLMKVRVPLNHFPVVKTARRHLMIAGGIGITPFLSMAHELDLAGAEFELHYCVRAAQHAPFAAMLQSRYGARVHVHDSARATRLDIAGLLLRQRNGTHLYVCGSGRMMDEVSRLIGETGWPSSCFHFERFKAAARGGPFSVVIHGDTERVVQVSPDQTMLEALEDAGIEIDSMCRIGACGKCRTMVQSHTGEIVHNDHVLDAEERAGGGCIIPCVSRLRGGEVVVRL